jgi:hypothetical protein
MFAKNLISIPQRLLQDGKKDLIHIVNLKSGWEINNTKLIEV